MDEAKQSGGRLTDQLVEHRQVGIEDIGEQFGEVRAWQRVRTTPSVPDGGYPELGLSGGESRVLELVDQTLS